MPGFTVLALGLLAGAVQVAVAQDCLATPALSSCASYIYPESMVLAGIEKNCFQMPWMIGCSIWNACQDGSMSSSSPYCEPFRVLATQCSDENMAGMDGCKGWAKMCLTTGTAVQQCSTSPPIPGVVATNPSQQAVIDACTAMSMPGCDTCTGLNNKCADTLASLQSVCLSMRMSECQDYYTMCTEAGPDLAFFCGSAAGASYDPPMQMYFHQRVADFILFRGWVPRTNGEYAGAIFACIFAAIFVSGLRAYRACHDAFYRIRDNLHIRHKPAEVSEANIFLLKRANLAPHIVRSALTFVMVVIDYGLMLTAMTFNVGIFFAIALGLSLGMLFFGHIPDHYAQRLQARAILSSDVECGCGTMLPVGADAAKRMDDDPSWPNTRSNSTDMLAPRSLVNPPAAQPGSCCAVPAAAPSCCGSSVTSSASLLHMDDLETRPPPMKICCTMQPILDAEEDTQPSCVEASEEMVPSCCRL